MTQLIRESLESQRLSGLVLWLLAIAILGELGSFWGVNVAERWRTPMENKMAAYFLWSYPKAAQSDDLANGSWRHRTEVVFAARSLSRWRFDSVEGQIERIRCSRGVRSARLVRLRMLSIAA
jgi:hypothetical protein